MRNTGSFGKLLFLSALVFLSACKQPEIPGYTVEWQLDGDGFIQFSTNDTGNCGYGFMTHFPATYQSTMTTIEAVVKQTTGSANAGYGIVYGYQDSDNYYVLLISNDGWIHMYKKINGTHEQTWGWTPSEFIKKGLGVENTIRVTQTSNNHFSIYINNMSVPMLELIDIGPTGGECGFIVGIAPEEYEDFPDTSEDMRFKITMPTVIP